MAKRPKLTIAIDLGSTYCGFAYSVDDGEIKPNNKWLPEHGQEHIKTPTALLYDENGAFQSFGFKTHSNISGQRGRHFYRYFKKSADDTSRLFRFSDAFYNQSGEVKNRLDLHADILEQLKDTCLKQIQDTQGSDFPPPQMHEIMWILCVPMVWAIHEKEFMVAAAFQAGLITELKSTNIMVILEGDASYSFCASLKPEVDFEPRLSTADIQRLKKSKAVLVEDIGGKTVDTTYKQVSVGTDNFIPFEKRIPSGLSVGGEGVNIAFENKLKNCLGDAFIREMKKDHLPSWLVFMEEFEIQKKKYQKEPMLISKTAKFQEIYKKFSKGKELSEVLEESNSGMSIDEEHGWLRLEPYLVDMLFDQTVDKITEHIAEKLDEYQVDVLYLTGGFATSKYLHQKVTKAVNDRAMVVVPKNPDQSVLVGAILYSRSHKNLSIHQIETNYGIATKDYFEAEDKEMHPPIFEKGKQILKGRVYEGVALRSELEDETLLPIYKNGKSDFITFELSGTTDPEASVRVQLQIAENENNVQILQVTVTDEITRECFIKRAKIVPDFSIGQSFQKMFLLFVCFAVVAFAVWWQMAKRR